MTLYVAKVYKSWKGSLELVDGFSGSITELIGTKSTGFLLVFESLEDLRAEYPEAGYEVIRTVEAA